MGTPGPSEIGKMYKKDGQEPPFTGWTGLWLFPGAILLVPAIVWFVKLRRALNRYWEGEYPRAWSHRLADGAYQRWNDATTMNAAPIAQMTMGKSQR